jgi:hypothetical protein
LAASLPFGPDADQLRLFAEEFVEMAVKLEITTTAVVSRPPETEGQ